jgi:hypothetical protein
MRAGRQNMPIDLGPHPNQCRSVITLRYDDGETAIELPCQLNEHPLIEPHMFRFDWADHFADKALLPEPPRYVINPGREYSLPPEQFPDHDHADLFREEGRLIPITPKRNRP